MKSAKLQEGVVPKSNGADPVGENEEFDEGSNLQEASIGAYLSNEMSIEQFKRDRRKALSYVVEHSGFVALLVSFVAFFLGFLYYVFQCGRAWFFGISFESIGQTGSNSLFTVTLCIAASSFFLLTNYLAYNKIKSQNSGLGIAKSIAKYFFISFALLVVVIVVFFVIEVGVSGLPNPSAEPSVDGWKTFVLLILMALLFMLILFFIGGMQGFIEWKSLRRLEQKSHKSCFRGFGGHIKRMFRRKPNQKSKKMPESKSGYKRVGEEIMLWMISLGVITAGTFFIGLSFSTTLFTPRIVVPACGQDASSVVVFETSEKYCLEKFEETDGVLVIDKSHQEWVGSSGVEIEIRGKTEFRFKMQSDIN